MQKYNIGVLSIYYRTPDSFWKTSSLAERISQLEPHTKPKDDLVITNLYSQYHLTWGFGSKPNEYQLTDTFGHSMYLVRIENEILVTTKRYDESSSPQHNKRVNISDTVGIETAITKLITEGDVYWYKRKRPEVRGYGV